MRGGDDDGDRPLGRRDLQVDVGGTGAHRLWAGSVEADDDDAPATRVRWWAAAAQPQGSNPYRIDRLDDRLGSRDRRHVDEGHEVGMAIAMAADECKVGRGILRRDQATAAEIGPVPEPGKGVPNERAAHWAYEQERWMACRELAVELSYGLAP